MGHFIIREDIDFIPAGLRDYLNTKYESKKNGKPFTNQDIQQYTMRGKLPKEYGGHSIKVIEKTEYNLKILRIKGLENGKG